MISFGKHRGKKFEEVASSDANYCKWVLGIESPNGAMAEFQQFLKVRGNDPSSSQLTVANAASPQTQAPQLAARHAAPDEIEAAPPQFQNVSNTNPEAAGQLTPQLKQSTIFVFELLSEQRFALRAEKLDLEMNAASGLSMYLPRNIWAEIAAWPHQELLKKENSGQTYWTFPMTSYKDVLNRILEKGWKYEPVPDFVLKAVTGSGAVSHTENVSSEDLDLPSCLMPYQKEGVLFGYYRANGRVLIGDEMGLGKTLQALVLASLYVADWPVLVICPSSLRFVWKEQAERWLPEQCGGEAVQVITKGANSFRSDARLWVISYNLLADSRTASKFMTRPGGEAHHLVICDESHNIKEWSAKRTKAVVQVLQAAKRAILLSGTPTRNSPDELHAQLTGLRLPGIGAYQPFRKRYCLEKLSRFGSGQTIKRIVGARNAGELNLVLTRSTMIRRKKDQVLHELPPKRRQKVPIQPSNGKIIKEIQTSFANLAEGDVGVSTLFKQLAETKLPDVKEHVLEVLERGDEKFIVFAHHYEMLDGIEEALRKKLTTEGLSYVRIDGRTPADKRLDLVNSFQENEKCRVALLSITACCEGLTLTAAGLVIFAELYWVPGTVEQAEARAHRIGTTHTKVIVEFLVVSGSPDEVIYRKLERKKRDTSSVLDNEEVTLNAESLKERAYSAKMDEPATTNGETSAQCFSPTRNSKKRTVSESSGQPSLEKFFNKKANTTAHDFIDIE